MLGEKSQARTLFSKAFSEAAMKSEIKHVSLLRLRIYLKIIKFCFFELGYIAVK